MNEKPKKDILNLIGVLFIIFGIGAMINFIYNKEYALLFWLCYMGLILAGIGCFKKSDLLIVSQLNILLIPLILWNIDFFYILLTNSSLLGITDYFFNIENLITKIISLQHLFTIPLSLYALYLVKIKSKILLTSLISFFQVAIVFFITRATSSVEENINCVFRSCMNFTLPFYVLFWFIGFFAVIFVTNFVIVRIPGMKRDSKNSKQ